MAENKKTTNTADVTKKYKKNSQTVDIMKRLFRNRSAVLGMIIFLCIIVIALSADMLFDYETQVIKQDIMKCPLRGWLISIHGQRQPQS